MNFKFIILLLISLFLQCANKEFSYYSGQKPILPNSDIRVNEVKLLKKGDSVLKAKALLGEATIKTETQEGIFLEWCLYRTNYQKDSYKTLRDKPSEESYFIKIYGDEKGTIQKIEYKM